MIGPFPDTPRAFDGFLEDFLQSTWTRQQTATSSPKHTTEPNSTPPGEKQFFPPPQYDSLESFPFLKSPSHLCGSSSGFTPVFPKYYPPLHSPPPLDLRPQQPSMPHIPDPFLWDVENGSPKPIESDKYPMRSPKVPSPTVPDVLGEAISWRMRSRIQTKHVDINRSSKRLGSSPKAKKCFIKESFVWIDEQKYDLKNLENAYSMDDYKVVLQFRAGVTIRHRFEKQYPVAETFVQKLFTRAISLRWKSLDKEIELLLRRSLTDCDIQPGSYVKISESLLGNSTEQTARVLWIHNDMITVQLPSGSAKLPKWYVTAMDDPYKITWVRTFAEKVFSKHKEWVKCEGDIPEVKILRERICKTIDWIVNDHFDKWSDKYFIQGHELSRTEVTVLVDQKFARLYLKNQLSELRNDQPDCPLRQNLDKFESISANLWIKDLQEIPLYKRGIRYMINQERKTLYSRICCLTQMIEEYVHTCPDSDDSKLVNYLLFSYVKACALLWPKTVPHLNLHGSKSFRCLLSRVDLQLMLHLIHPEFMNERRVKTLELWSKVFEHLDYLLATS